MNFKLFCLLVGSLSFFGLKAQTEVVESENVELSEKILWLTLEEAEEKSEVMGRKILLFLYTDWCIWCKRMEKTTFKSDQIANYINSNFYPVKFDAEEQKSVNFRNKSYSFQDSEPRGIHELAMEMMGGRITYPTIAFFNENWELIQSIPNFHSEEKFEQIITYFAEDFFKKTPWSSYKRNYVPIGKK